MEQDAEILATAERLKRWLARPMTRFWAKVRRRQHKPLTWSVLTESRGPLSPDAADILAIVVRGQALTMPVNWFALAEALDYAARQNGYGTAATIADFALDRIRVCPEELRKRLLRRIVDSLAARALTEGILELLAAYQGELPKTGYAKAFFQDPLAFNVTEVSDKHALYLAIKHGLLQPSELTRLMARDREQLLANPSLHLLLFYACLTAMPNPHARKLASAAISHYLRVQGLAGLELSDITAENVLDQLRPCESTRANSLGTEAPLVTVICSAYSAESTLGYAIRSLLAQTHGNLEVLLCDDASQDRTFEVASALAKTDPRVRLFRSNANQGTYNVRNALIPLARGKYVTFHDGDDFALPERIERQLIALRESGAKACVANWVRILPQGLCVFFRDGNEKRLSIVSLMVERDLISQLLPYRSARHSADLEMFDRVRAITSADAEGAKGVVRVHAPLIFGLWSERSLTRERGAEALENGYRAPSRRRYAELCFRQRFQGKSAVSDEAIDRELEQLENLIQPRKIDEITVVR